MKNKMPLDGLGLGHDSGSVHCDMLKMLCFRTAWGGDIITYVKFGMELLSPNLLFLCMLICYMSFYTSIILVLGAKVTICFHSTKYFSSFLSLNLLFYSTFAGKGSKGHRKLKKQD